MEGLVANVRNPSLIQQVARRCQQRQRQCRSEHIEMAQGGSCSSYLLIVARGKESWHGTVTVLHAAGGQDDGGQRRICLRRTPSFHTVTNEHSARKVCMASATMLQLHKGAERVHRPRRPGRHSDGVTMHGSPDRRRQDRSCTRSRPHCRCPGSPARRKTCSRSNTGSHTPCPAQSALSEDRLSVMFYFARCALCSTFKQHGHPARTFPITVHREGSRVALPEKRSVVSNSLIAVRHA